MLPVTQNNTMSARVENASDAVAQTVMEVIDSQARSASESVFVVCPETGNTITFGELQQICRAVSSLLEQHGVARGAHVGMLLDNGLTTAALFLAIMYAGRVTVPLNPTLPVQGINQFLEQADCQLVFGDSKALQQGTSTDQLKLSNWIECDEHLLSNLCSKYSSSKKGDTISRDGSIDPDYNALLVYTSGSSGKPKGAMFTHRNVIAGGTNTAVAHHLTRADSSLCVLPLYHMYAQIVTLMSTLVSGGTVVVPSQFRVDRFWNQIKEYQCTWSALVPTLIAQLVKRFAGADSAHLIKGTSFRFARSSSAPLDPKLHKEFEQCFDVPLIEAMGITEAGGAVFSNPLPPLARKIGSPGLPYGFEVKVVDAQNLEVSAGTTGEILLRGASVMSGYYNNTELTNSVLNDDYYRTGDVGYIDDEGYVFIIGRVSEIINKGAEKIAPKEIEQFLKSIDEVDEVAVVGVPDPVWGAEIVAFVSLKNGSTTASSDLQTLCHDRLGAIKTPKRVCVVTEFPRAAAFKIDKKVLRERAINDANQCAQQHRKESNASASKDADSLEDDDLRLLRTEYATLIRDLWSEILQVERVQEDDDFFKLGGTSLLAISLCVKLHSMFDANCGLHDLMEHPTPRLLAARVCDLILSDETVYNGGLN